MKIPNNYLQFFVRQRKVTLDGVIYLFKSSILMEKQKRLYLVGNQVEPMRVKTTFIHMRILMDGYCTCFLPNFATAIV